MSITPDEVTFYRQSVLEASTRLSLENVVFLVTLDGKGASHRMGIVAAMTLDGKGASHRMGIVAAMTLDGKGASHRMGVVAAMTPSGSSSQLT